MIKTVMIYKNGKAVATVWNAKGYFQRLRGLLGRTIKEGGGLLLTPCGSIHTFGMRYDIDAVYLDRTGVVLRVDEALKPGKAWPGERKAYRVLELASGHADRCGIHVGDKLEVIS
ncbi:MAG: DUF192 domain-containing protein [Eubacteriales bacterium]